MRKVFEVNEKKDVLLCCVSQSSLKSMNFPSDHLQTMQRS